MCAGATQQGARLRWRFSASKKAALKGGKKEERGLRQSQLRIR